MNRRNSLWLKIGLVFILALGLALGASFQVNPNRIGQAASSQAASSQAASFGWFSSAETLPADAAANADGLWSDYLIVLPLPEIELVESYTSQAEAPFETYSHALLSRQARPILAALRGLQRQGKIGAYELSPELWAVTVQAVDEGVLAEAVGQMPGAALAAQDGQNACALATADAVADRVVFQSHEAGRERIKNLRAQFPATVDATDPSIRIYLYPDLTWGYISGSTVANTPVNLRLWRAGRLVVSETTTSSSSGSYSFYPDWVSCPTSGYLWLPMPGDVVEVTANGSTVTTEVAALSAWLDPGLNLAAGQTNPGRTVAVDLTTSDGCTSTWFNQTSGVDGNGNFSVDFSGVVDFNARAYAYIYSFDAAANYTYSYYEAFQLYLEFGSKYFYGVIKPSEAYTATLLRGGVFYSGYLGDSDAGGNFSGDFYAQPQGGDVIQIDSPGAAMSYTLVDFQVGFDAAANQASGVTGAQRQIVTYFYKNDWDEVITSCDYQYECAPVMADGGGNFTLASSMDLVNGDLASFYVYDANGNYQYASDRHVPTIVAHPKSMWVSGFWKDPSAEIEIIHKDSGGLVKGEESATTYYDGEYHGYFSDELVGGDIIEVGDGVYTQSMTVQNLSVRLDGASGQVFGGGYNGNVLADLYDFRRDVSYGYGYCSQGVVSGGIYSLGFSGAQVGGHDSVEVWNTGPDGHYTYGFGNTFTVNVQKEGSQVWGYSETPGADVTVQLWRGGGVIATKLTTSFNGSWSLNLADGGPVTIQQGDQVQVQTNDGEDTTLPIPQLTSAADGVNNRVYGAAPANEPVWAHLFHATSPWSYDDTRKLTTSDAAGAYSATFDGWWYDCSAMDAGSQCAFTGVEYYTPEGHLIQQADPLPDPVAPDAFEADDDDDDASDYTGRQSHTFHEGDGEDWVAFDVPQADVDAQVPYQLNTLNLGPGLRIKLSLYSQNGHTQIDFDYGDPQNPAAIRWTPPSAGTYFARIAPDSSSDAGYCGAFYDLLIVAGRYPVFLPVMTR